MVPGLLLVSCRGDFGVTEMPARNTGRCVFYVRRTQGATLAVILSAFGDDDERRQQFTLERVAEQSSTKHRPAR